MYISKTVITAFAILLLVVLVIVLWSAGTFNGLISMLTPATGEQTVETQQETLPKELATGSDSSDQALEADEAQLNAELEAYGEASAELDQSLEDEQVAQEY